MSVAHKSFFGALCTAFVSHQTRLVANPSRVRCIEQGSTARVSKGDASDAVPAPHLMQALIQRLARCTDQTLTSASDAHVFSVRCLFEAQIHFRFKHFVNGFDSNQSQGYLGAT
jgi:hypothetical protein